MRTKVIIATAAGLIALGFGSSPLRASEHEVCGVDVSAATPAATVSGSVKTIGFIASVRWGQGVLTLANGDERKFKILGAKALETGAAVNEFEGEIYNLENVDDFAGTYYGASTNINVGTLGKGEAVANNARCVVVKLRMSGTGLKVSGPAPGGVEVTFVD